MRFTHGVRDHRVVFLLYPGVQALDITGPHEVFDAATRVMAGLGHVGGYDLTLAGTTAGPVATESGLGVVAANRLDELDGPIHTLVIPGGDGARRDQPAIVDWLRTNAPRCERIATVCTGTFLAAAAGLCDGRRVTTHWARAGTLASRYPELEVDPDPIYIHDGDLWTSAGVTAGIDLALALVEADRGPEVARWVARHLVVYLHRPGGQSQFATPVWAQPTEVAPIREAVEIIHDDLDGDLSVPALAARVGLSTRHFTRRFRQEIGEPVGRHVERHRVEAARQMLEATDVGLDAVAARCGFGSAETLRRAFHRRLDMSPDTYRRQFATSQR